MWFCPGCGGEYKHADEDNPGGDSKGPDFKFNYVIFMRFDLDSSVQAMCAMAEAPMTT